MKILEYFARIFYEHKQSKDMCIVNTSTVANSPPDSDTTPQKVQSPPLIDEDPYHFGEEPNHSFQPGSPDPNCTWCGGRGSYQACDGFFSEGSGTPYEVTCSCCTRKS